MIGWIFWDPGAIERYTALGLPGPLGYVAARAAPLGPAGNEAVIAAFSTIRPEFIALALDEAREQTTWEAVWEARDEAVVEGLRAFVPASCEAIARMGPWLWDAVDECPLGGRVFFGAHLRMPRPEDPLLSAWHAVNCLREWRGDTHLAILASEGLDAVEGSILHNAWVGYEGDWVAASRGWDDESIGAAYRRLESRGLAVAGAVTEAGLALRQAIEDRTDGLTTVPWEVVGEERSRRFAEVLEPPCEVLLARVDETAGAKYMPASRRHPRLEG